MDGYFDQFCSVIALTLPVRGFLPLFLLVNDLWSVTCTCIDIIVVCFNMCGSQCVDSLPGQFLEHDKFEALDLGRAMVMNLWIVMKLYQVSQI